MTSFTDPDVYQCPACAAFALRSKLRTLTFGRMCEWTDGVPTQWWASVNTPLVRCRACNALFWLEDVEPVGVLPRAPRPLHWASRAFTYLRGDPHRRLRAEKEWHALPDGWKSAERFDTPDFEDIRYVLANPDSLSHDRLLWLRLQLWWQLNDRFRARSDGSPIPDVPTIPEEEEQTNKMALIGLLKLGRGKSDNDVARAELLRQLGHFDEALSVLRSVPTDGTNGARATQIAQLARAGDGQVRAIVEER